MKSFSKIRKGFALVLPLAAFSFLGVLVAQEPRREQEKNAAPAPRGATEKPAENKGRDGGRNAAPANPPREGERGARPEGERGARPEGERGARPEGERGARPEGGRPEAGSDAKERLLNGLNLSKDERAKVESILAAREEKMREVQQSTMKAIRDTIGEEKFQSFIRNSSTPNRGAGAANPPREGDKRPEAGKPEAGRPEGERKAGPANPPREGDRGAKPEAGRPEGDRKGGPGAGPEARERILNELNLSKDVRAKVEAILSSQQEKMKDIIAKGKEGNGDREKIMAEVREMQQAMVKNLKEIMGEDKFRMFIKNAPMFIRGAGPDGTPKRGDGQGRDSSRQKE